MSGSAPEYVLCNHHHCTTTARLTQHTIRKDFQIWGGGPQGLQMFNVYLCFEGMNQGIEKVEDQKE